MKEKEEFSLLWAGEEAILIILRGRYQFRPQAHITKEKAT